MTETATNEHPIPFSGSMVRAVLEGRKTQMRRVVNPQPPKWVDAYSQSADPNHWLPSGVYISDPCGVLGRGSLSVRKSDMPIRCPFGVPGDRLWVRETWRVGGLDVGGYRSPIRVAIDYKASPEIDRTPWVQGATGEWLLRMRDQTLDDANQKGVDQWDHGESPARWRPSIHMPRWASRITLVVKRVWVERVQEISDIDAYAEGVEMVSAPKPPGYGVPGLAPTFKHYQNPDFNGGRGVGVKHSFQTLWDSINASKGYGWDTKPWVWCVEFERVEDGR